MRTKRQLKPQVRESAWAIRNVQGPESATRLRLSAVASKLSPSRTQMGFSSRPQGRTYRDSLSRAEVGLYPEVTLLVEGRLGVRLQ